MSNKARSIHEKEYIAELLKERIYATLALLAVLVGIDTQHSTPLHAEFIIAGTILSLWAASIVSTQMSRRVIFQGDLDVRGDREDQIRKHAPMLSALAFPSLMILLSGLGIISLQWAVNISIISSLLLIVGWSIASARSLNVKRMPIAIIAAIELAIGLGVVGLKVAIGH